MPIEIYTSEIIDKSLSAQDLAFLIRIFKGSREGESPIYLGKDVPYHRPNRCASSGLRHVHVLDNVDPREWARARTSDSHLVYTNGYFNANVYYLIAFLSPDAHDQARDMMRLSYFCDIADDFRLQY